MTTEEKIAWAREQLTEKYKELGRIPKKEDFDDGTRSRIKAFLGPWPRALETVGLKEAKPAQPRKRKRAARKAASSMSERQKASAETEK